MLKHLLLEYLYQHGYRFIVKDKCGWIMAYASKPEKSIDNSWMVLQGKCRTLGVFSDVFDYVLCEEPLDIVKELNIINWHEVPPNTKVYVRNHVSEPWKLVRYIRYEESFPAHFAVYDDCTSSTINVEFYNYCKLA